MGYTPVNPSVAALQYGRDTEERAGDAYLQHQVSIGHKNININTTGLIVCKEHVFLGASPDLFVSCDCCGDGLVEIKCPYNVRLHNKVFAADCLSADDEGNIRLMQSHDYYAQIQGQLAICEKKFCDFVVYNAQDIFVERIILDEDYWLKMLNVLSTFYFKFILPECITYGNRPSYIVENVKQKYKRANYMAAKNFKESERNDSSLSDVAILDVACNATIGKGWEEEFVGACLTDTVTVVKETVSNVKADMIVEVSMSSGENQICSSADNENVDPCTFCPICTERCKDGMKQFCWQSIFCECCKFWLHMKCAKLTKTKLQLLGDQDFVCVQCKQIA